MEIYDIIRLIETAKSGGDYWAANVLFVAALHIATRGGSAMEDLWPITMVEVDIWAMPGREDGEVGYYDLFNIVAGDVHTCIPMPMLREDLALAAYANASRTIERRVHDRQPDTSTPDVWTDRALGWLRMGEEAIPTWLSAVGMAEVEWLRGERVGQVFGASRDEIPVA